ncbi:excisionase family DNA binding protein [Bradyrhizobium sp. AZCC 1578]|uniref:helix-turn-helix domain-containing protein n=1 Tax=Bradyrhizobium sp. AZCC 1578 TaxID=3117027 RepID=UPI002FF18679
MRNKRQDIDPDKCLTYLVPEAGAMLGLTRNASYAAAKRGDIPTIRIGKLLRVPKAAFDRLLAQAGAK